MKTLTTPEVIVTETIYAMPAQVNPMIDTSLLTIEIPTTRTVRTSRYATHQAEIITKGTDFIIGYINNQEVFSFSGISNFEGYHLAEGEEWDTPLLTQEEINRIQGHDIAENELLLRENMNIVIVTYPQGQRYEELKMKYGLQWINQNQLQRYQNLGDINEIEYLQIVGAQ